MFFGWQLPGRRRGKCGERSLLETIFGGGNAAAAGRCRRKYFVACEPDDDRLDAIARSAIAMKLGRGAKIRTSLTHCAAFVPSSVSPELWMPCNEPALRRGLFCAKHRDAIDGAVLGAHSLGLLPKRSDRRRGSQRSAGKKRQAAKRKSRGSGFVLTNPELKKGFGVCTYKP